VNPGRNLHDAGEAGGNIALVEPVVTPARHGAVRAKRDGVDSPACDINHRAERRWNIALIEVVLPPRLGKHIPRARGVGGRGDDQGDDGALDELQDTNFPSEKQRSLAYQRGPIAPRNPPKLSARNRRAYHFPGQTKCSAANPGCVDLSSKSPSEREFGKTPHR